MRPSPIPTDAVPWAEEMMNPHFSGCAILHELNCPKKYNAQELFYLSNHRHFLMCDPLGRRRVAGCHSRHLGCSPDVFNRGSIKDVSNERLLEFLKDLLEVETRYPGLRWVGFAITWRRNRLRSLALDEDYLVEYYLVADRRGVSVPYEVEVFGGLVPSHLLT